MYRLVMGIGGWIFFVDDSGDVPTMYWTETGEGCTMTVEEQPVAWELVELYD